MLPTLSCRQGEILQLIAEGFSTREMAPLMGLSYKTIEKHRQVLMNRLDVHQVSGLTRYAVAAGVIEINTTPLTRPAFAGPS